MQVQTINNNTNLSFKMKFKLSKETEKALERSTGKTIEELRSKSLNLHEKNIKHYQPGDLIYPRNVYLQQGRLISAKEVQKGIDSFGETPFSRLKKWISNIFTKNNRH